MKTIITKILLLILLLNFNSFAQIYSASGGGEWAQDSTWVGGVVPTKNDDVVINSFVKANAAYDSLFCKNLTVNEGAALYCDNYGSYGASLHVFGNLVNNGTISQSAIYWDFTIFLYGNLTNNGGIKNKAIRFVSEEKQQISASTEIGVRGLYVDNKQDIELASDVTFVDNWIEMDGADLIIPENTTLNLVKTDTAVYSIIRGVNFLGGGTLNMDGYYTDDTSSVENIELTGCIKVGGNFRIGENVTLADTLMHYTGSYYDVMVFIDEDFTNDGVIMDNPELNTHLDLYISKSIINNGTWKNNFNILVGEADQTFTNNDSLASSFRLNAGLPNATSFQWYKDDIIIEDATDSSYYHYYLSSAVENYDSLYGEYYCQTNIGTSRNISILNGNVDTTFVLEQDFDGSEFPPSGWEVVTNNSWRTWNQNNPSSHSFSGIDAGNVYSALCSWDSGEQDEWLISPEFTLENESPKLDFYAGYSTSWLDSATLKLNISTDDGSTWTQLWECEDDGESWSWRLCTVDLSEYKDSSSLKLGWQYVGRNGDLVALDQIRLHTLTGIEKEGEVLSMEYKLEQNYPNPFNPTTKISFSLPKNDFVKLAVYNILGEKVATLVNKNMQAGKYTYEFNADRFASGVYIYRLETSSFSNSKKMILLK